MVDHYHNLNLSPNASAQEIANAFDLIRKKMGTYAPGITISDDLIKTNYPEAWNAHVLLSDPSSKAAYDAMIKAASAQADAEVPAQPRSLMKSILPYAAAVGLVGAILLFFALLGSGI
jgi:DnaJ-class molecular chaperone